MSRNLDLDTVDWANITRFNNCIKAAFLICLSWNTVGINLEVEQPLEDYGSSYLG